MNINEIGREAHQINAGNGWDVFIPQDWTQRRSDEERLEMWNIEKPHLRTHNESCMGDPDPNYWAVWATNKTDPEQSAFGRGDTPEAALAMCRATILKQNDAFKLCTHMALVHSEVSEATEAVRHRDRQNFDEELADVVIRVASIAHGLGTDLDSAITAKLAKNRTRGLHHGGKAV
jgi:NTP pyrophosphatase (non-canonical NTP hydrolase)